MTGCSLAVWHLCVLSSGVDWEVRSSWHGQRLLMCCSCFVPAGSWGCPAIPTLQGCRFNKVLWRMVLKGFAFFLVKYLPTVIVCFFCTPAPRLCWVHLPCGCRHIEACRVLPYKDVFPSVSETFLLYTYWSCENSSQLPGKKKGN